MDDLDRRVLDQLLSDGRVPVAGIAKTLGISRAVAGQRLERLLDSGVVRVAGVVDAAVFGRDLSVTLRMTVEDAADRVAAEVAAIDEVQWVATVDDFTTIVAQASVTSREALRRLINESIRGITNVVSLQGSINLAVHLTTPGTTDTPESTDSDDDGTQTLRHDEIDLQILTILQSNGRTTITSMAQRVGLSVPAARQRMLRLLRSGSVRIGTFVEPTKLGYRPPVAAAVKTTVDPAELIPGIRSMAVPPQYAVEQSGPADLVLYFVGLTEAEFEANVRTLRTMPGIAQVNIEQYRHVFKDTQLW